ncbi:MAG TPA: MXAN_6640 family putative metalloprotease [Nocardioides sp.]|nr:MXAN_6640 family putative metalloprotease [Nocardioides sp.]
MTLALRDLWVSMDDLAPADRVTARALLARPNLTNGKKVCKGTICIHYTTTGSDAVKKRDVSPHNGIPDYVDLTLKTVRHIHDVYINAGYRAPLPDGGKSGSNALDVFLEDDGAQGYYGYCAPDQNTPQGVYTSWSYCSFDNDFSPTQFPTNTPRENLQVTAAHEYFHATQFAYDAYEDHWILEATATWAEDELYPDVNDNLQYLPDGPIGRPEAPLDLFESCCHQYGTWIFFRYLTEEFPTERGALPELILQLWKRLDSKGSAPDDYSMQGVENVLASHGTDIAHELGVFAVANRFPALAYAEGSLYPTANAAVVDVSGSSLDPATFSKTLKHLSTSTVRYEPDGLTEANWNLDLAFDLAPTAQGSAAVIATETPGQVNYQIVSLDANGDADVAVPFSSQNVTAVEVTLVNAGTAYDCWNGGNFSCQGTSLSDGLVQQVNPLAYQG